MEFRFSKQFDNALPVSSGREIQSSTSPQAAATYLLFWKRFLDVGLVLFTAPISLSIVIIACAFVKLDGGPMFFSQPRIGKGGKMFRIFKLRTMHVDAEQRLTEILMQNPCAAFEWQKTQKLRHDPRITLVGKLLRKTSVDELPQLWNVVLGDMSLVGPRPILRDQILMYPGKAYFRLLPGITGPWQVFGRNEESFTARAKYDAMYERKVSAFYDASLIIRTVGVVLWGTGR